MDTVYSDIYLDVYNVDNEPPVVKTSRDDNSVRIIRAYLTDHGKNFSVSSTDTIMLWGKKSDGTPANCFGEYFVIDAGWYAPKTGPWYNRQGDWVPSSDRFPSGLKKTAQAQHIRSVRCEANRFRAFIHPIHETTGRSMLSRSLPSSSSMPLSRTFPLPVKKTTVHSPSLRSGKLLLISEP